MADQKSPDTQLAQKPQAAPTKPQTAISTVMEKLNDYFLPKLNNQLSSHGINMDGYQRQCALNCISSIHKLAVDSGKEMNELDKSNVLEMLQMVAGLRLNSYSIPREVYFQLRNKNIAAKGQQAKWVSQVEMGVEGDGNDALLRNFGADVKKVYPHWLVREGDKFTYPKMKGIEMTPPEWEQTGKGKIVRVVYPVQSNDGSINYYIAEREDVRKNLYAHITSNMMNETFGIAAKKFDATPDQKKKIDAEKAKVKESMVGKSVEEILDMKELEKWISPAWREDHSRESMIIRKMRNNAIKPIPKDFGSALATSMYMETSDETTGDAMREMRQNANSGPVIDADYMDVVDPPQLTSPDENGEVTETPPAPEDTTPPEPEQTTLGNPEKDPGF